MSEYQYSILPDSRLKRILVSPVTGKIFDIQRVAHRDDPRVIYMTVAAHDSHDIHSPVDGTVYHSTEKYKTSEGRKRVNSILYIYKKGGEIITIENNVDKKDLLENDAILSTRQDMNKVVKFGDVIGRIPHGESFLKVTFPYRYQIMTEEDPQRFPRDTKYRGGMDIIAVSNETM